MQAYIAYLLGRSILRASPYTISANFAYTEFYEVRIAREATQYALVIATIVRRCDYVASKGHRGPPTLLHGDVEGYGSMMERLKGASCIGPRYWTSIFGIERSRICSPARYSSR